MIALSLCIKMESLEERQEFEKDVLSRQKRLWAQSKKVFLKTAEEVYHLCHGDVSSSTSGKQALGLPELLQKFEKYVQPKHCGCCKRVYYGFLLALAIEHKNAWLKPISSGHGLRELVGRCDDQFTLNTAPTQPKFLLRGS